MGAQRYIYLVVKGEVGEGYYVVGASATLRGARLVARRLIAHSLRPWAHLKAIGWRWVCDCDYLEIVRERVLP